MLDGLMIGSPLGAGGDTVVDLEVDTVGSDSRLDCALVEFVSNFGAYSDKKSAILPRRKMPPITRTSPQTVDRRHVNQRGVPESLGHQHRPSGHPGEQVRPEPRSLVVAEGGNAGCESGQATLRTGEGSIS